MWNLEGLIVRGVYFDQPVEGVVTLSRVKYGGAVQHTVDLFHSITMFGQERTMVLLDANEIVHVEYESVIACEFDQLIIITPCNKKHSDTLVLHGLSAYI